MTEPTSELVFTIVDIPTTKRTRRQPWRLNPRWLTCANCSTVFCSERGYLKVYCGLQCDSIARAVRYRRSVNKRYGDEIPDDVMEGVRYKWAHALGGGYDERARRLAPERRAEVILRDAGRCVRCGEPGVEIDHIAGPSDHMTNLQLLCVPCHHAKTDEQIRPIAADDHETRALAMQMRVRVEAEEPLVVCDATDWATQWRAWAKAHEAVAPPSGDVVQSQAPVSR